MICDFLSLCDVCVFTRMTLNFIFTHNLTHVDTLFQKTLTI
jgi:hypothetical protein